MRIVRENATVVKVTPADGLGVLNICEIEQRAHWSATMTVPAENKFEVRRMSATTPIPLSPDEAAPSTSDAFYDTFTDYF